MKRKDVSEKKIKEALTKHNSNLTNAARELGCTRQLLSYWVQNEKALASAFKQNQLTQKQRDQLRILRRENRMFDRISNGVQGFSDQLTAVFDANPLNYYSPVKKARKKAVKGSVGVLQLSDVHFGEQVELPNNTYNFSVATKRIQALVMEAKLLFHAKGITHVLVAFTGDMFNSDRRLDELLSNATARSQALFVATDILQQALRDLAEDFTVSVASISGNESRLGKEIGFIPQIVSDNYDFTLHHVLAHVLKKDARITFLQDDNPSEVVVNVAGSNLLLIHGHIGIKANKNVSTMQIKARYAEKGTVVDYVIFGHMHQACISDEFSRSSSLVGANDYSDINLNLSGRASQNLYVFETNGNRHGYKIDLQNVNNYRGYPIDNTLKEYANRPLPKGSGTVMVHKV